MAWNATKQPNLNHKDLPTWCLRFSRNVFGIGSKWEFSQQAWENNKQRHTDALPNVPVFVFFSWTGTVDGVRKNWGDVAVWVPGRGVFGTPLKGSPKSNRWDSSVQARAKAIGGGAQYLGWSPELNGVSVASWTPDPVAPAPQPNTGSLRINPGTWSARTSPKIIGQPGQPGNNIVGNGKTPVLGGQQYGINQIDSNGWANITFTGKSVWIGPKTYTRI